MSKRGVKYLPAYRSFPVPTLNLGLGSPNRGDDVLDGPLRVDVTSERVEGSRLLR